ncbi:PREDICTED: uncharacterized protein LOC108612050 isoform X1 [Drosophila arizonae]|uniref:Uncharacterized protein LOC108612050 isoform X1 n=1 Tax=Drosophila arizonae TaxID=7263 RepID=A0ABM1NZP1_DROAR|nr:PREDICTED: uncharacterized protein LOC108612050 isoform X1 [Drosophila arizonae]
MERWSGLRYIHSNEERDEDYLQRISVCLSIDISEMIDNRINTFGKIFAAHQEHRSPGGGLFGSIEDKYTRGSRLSFTVPNKFFARKRSGLERHRKKHQVPYGWNPDSNSRNDIYKPERYTKCSDRCMSAVPPRPNLMESYECPNQLSFDPYEQHYKHPRYKPNYAKPPAEWDYPPEWDSRNKKRYGSLENTKLSNSFYKCEFPNKLHDRSYSSHPSEYQDYAVTKPNSIDRTRFRQPSGYANSEHLEVPYHNHNQRDCYTDYNPNVKYSPDYDSEWKYNPIPNVRYNYPEPALSYDCDYEYNPELYRRSPYQKKSVDFLGVDCEIPYNILKTKRNMLRTQRQNYEYPESLSCFELLSVDIPFKETMPNHIPNFNCEYDCGRPESGYDYYAAAKPMPRNVDYDSDFMRSNSICRGSTNYYRPQRKHHKSLKEKISGFFKRSKSKARIQSKPKHRPDGKEQRSISNFNNLISHKTAVSKSGSNASRITSSFKSPRCFQRKPSYGFTSIRKKTRCNVYPTVYRVTRGKVNNTDVDTANDDNIKGCCDYYRKPESIVPAERITAISKEAGFSCTAKAKACHSCHGCHNRDDHMVACRNPNENRNVNSKFVEDNQSLASSTMVCCHKSSGGHKKCNEPELSFAAVKPQASCCSLGLSPPKLSCSRQNLISAEPKCFPTEHKVSFAQLHSEQLQKCAPSDRKVSCIHLHSDNQSMKCSRTIPEPSLCMEELPSCPYQITAKRNHLENDYFSVRNNQCTISPDPGPNSSLICIPEPPLPACKCSEQNTTPFNTICIKNSAQELAPPAANAEPCSMPIKLEPVRVCSKSQLPRQAGIGNCAQSKNDAPSYVEELKRELLAELEKEQRMNAQLPYQNPTPHIMVFPTPPPANPLCPICPEPAARDCPYMKCWRPL